ncbi:uncharacterized protein LOC129598718 isoform X2 [Paramacrobiotus metropolitanus]|nr:uncharacterized protein LOC129598718 isoform X2 [Paramacrobiotus metropolitanus]
MWYHLPFATKADVNASISLLDGSTAWFQQICMHCSDWILVAFSWERLLIIISPFRFRLLQRVSTAWIIIAILCLVALPIGVFQFVSSYEYLYYVHRADDIRHPTSSAPVWFNRWLKIDGEATVIVQIVTFILILMPSVCLIVFLGRQHQSTISQMRLQQLQSARSRPSLNRSDSRSETGTTIILLSSSALYLATRFPTVVQSCLLYLGDVHYDWTVELFAGAFVDIAMYAGYSFTFFTYLVTTKNFREHAFKLFTPLLSKSCSCLYHPGSWWFCVCFRTGMSPPRE